MHHPAGHSLAAHEGTISRARCSYAPERSDLTEAFEAHSMASNELASNLKTNKPKTKGSKSNGS